MTKKQRKILIRIIITAILFLGLVVAEHMGFFGEYEESWLLLPVYLVPYLLIGYDILLKAARNIRNGQVFDENFLMMLATFGAFGIREFTEAVAVSPINLILPSPYSSFGLNVSIVFAKFKYEVLKSCPHSDTQ